MVRVRKCSNEHCELNAIPPDAETEYILDDFAAPSSAARSWQAVVDEYYSEAGRLYPSSAIRKCSICGDRGTGVMKRRLLTVPPCLALSMEQRIDQFDVSSELTVKIHEVSEDGLRGTVTICKYTLRSMVEHRPGHYVAFAHFEFPEKRLFYHDDLANHGYAVPIPGPRAKMITASDGTPALSFYVLESLESSTTALPTTETSSLAAGTSAVVADTSAVAADEITAGPRHAIRKRKREGDESSAVVQNPGVRIGDRFASFVREWTVHRVQGILRLQ